MAYTDSNRSLIGRANKWWIRRSKKMSELRKEENLEREQQEIHRWKKNSGQALTSFTTISSSPRFCFITFWRKYSSVLTPEPQILACFTLSPVIFKIQGCRRKCTDWPPTDLEQLTAKRLLYRVSTYPRTPNFGPCRTVSFYVHSFSRYNFVESRNKRHMGLDALLGHLPLAR